MSSLRTPKRARTNTCFSAIAFIGIVGTFMAVGATAPNLFAQSGSTAATSKTPVPQWQIDAGGKAEFDVVSVKPNTAEPNQQTVSTNVPLGPMDAYTPTGGLLSAKNQPLLVYMVFAYKLTSSQVNALLTSLPKWANTTRYDIQAHAPAGMTPSKDQLRLMMQALLADRFKLAIHYETRQMPVMALVLDKPGKLGPKLQLHPADQPCSTVPVSLGQPVPAKTTEGFPQTCGALAAWLEGGLVHAGGRNMDLQVVANQLTNPILNIDRPVLDRTGLTGKYDFIFEFTPQFNGPPPPGLPPLDESGPTLQEAMKAELGIKLEPQTGPVDVIVVDHVEQPSEN